MMVEFEVFFVKSITNLPCKFAICKFEPNVLIAVAVIEIHNSILRPHYGFVLHVRLSDKNKLK